MIPSGNGNGSAGDPKKHKHPRGAMQKYGRQQVLPPTYHPSIYRYTCNGALHLSSDQKGSPGHCRGIRSRLELLSDLDVTTREGALKDFTDMNDLVIDSETGAGDLSQQTKSIILSPTLIYNDARGRAKAEPQLPEEELIKKQWWSCYGSTEVEYLVLQDKTTGQQRISALSPRNRGMSIRTIESDSGQITNVMIGWLSIVLDISSFDDTETPAAETTKEKELSSNNTATNNLQNSVYEGPPKPNQDILQGAKRYAQNTYAFSLKVAEHIKGNTTWLAGQLQDDFPARALSAGQKITSNIYKTADRTFGFMSKMAHKWWDDSGGHDDNDRGR